MKKATIFYSWQNQNKEIKTHIRKEIEFAIKELSKEKIIFECDESTRNIPGAPDIIKSITEKIDKCSLFVCDVSKVCENDNINPNVLFELGYALKSLGKDRIILLQYSNTGIDLPFDIAHLRTSFFNDLQKSNHKISKECIIPTIKLLKENNQLIPIPQNAMDRFIIRLQYYPEMWIKEESEIREAIFDLDYLGNSVEFKDDIDESEYHSEAYLINYHHQINQFFTAYIKASGNILQELVCQILDKRYCIVKPRIKDLDLDGESYKIYYFLENSLDYALYVYFKSTTDGLEAQKAYEDFEKLILLAKNEEELKCLISNLSKRQKEIKSKFQEVHVPCLLEDELLSCYKTPVLEEKIIKQLENNYKLNSVINSLNIIN